jgi:hypothetical protein
LKVDGKDLIQKAWVVEGMALLVYLCFAWWLMPPERLKIMVEMLPQIVLIIGGQGIAASAGPEAKRWILSKKQPGEKPV